MRQEKVDVVVVGADRIAANGDTANKIGTYMVAVLAHRHNVPFYIAAPRSTIDPTITDGHAIPIEQRDPREVTHFHGRPVAPEGVSALNPAFDVTPHSSSPASLPRSASSKSLSAERFARHWKSEGSFGFRISDIKLRGGVYGLRGRPGKH